MEPAEVKLDPGDAADSAWPDGLDAGVACEFLAFLSY